MSTSKNKRRYCCVFGCLKNSYEDPTLSFFSIPVEENVRLQWLRLIDREDLIDKAVLPRICEVHFNVQDILVRTKRKILKKNCLPSLHLNSVRGEVKETQTDIITATSSSQTERVIRSDNITQTPISLFADAQHKRKLKILEEELSSCKRRLRLHAIELNTTKAQREMFYKLCDRFLSTNLAELVKAQTHLNSSNKGNRYTLAYKKFCLNLYCANPQAYGLLQKTICLPCRATLNNLHIPISTEVNGDLMAALKLKVNNMSEKEKQCSLVVDSIKLRANLFYEIKNDKIIGFCEVDGVQSPLPAKHALVLMIRGIYVKWSQVIGFAFLSECKSDDSVSKWIDKIILNLLQIGLKVRLFATDLKSNWLDAAKRREISVDKTYFTIDDTKIYYIFDVPHLIKLIRNNLMLYDFHFNGNAVAKFHHIVQFYENDQKMTLKQAYKLTKSHIYPTNVEKIKVRYATQLLSRSVASGLSTYIDFNIIDQSARHTVEFIKNMNDLFDALNSSNIRHSYSYKSAFCGNLEQVEFFKNILILFKNLKLHDPNNGNDVTESTESVKFIQGFQVTIQSVLNLYEDLKQEGYQYLLTRQLNKDNIIKNIFSKIKAKNINAKSLSCRQFISTFRNIYFANITQATKEDNFGENLAEFLGHLKDFEKTANVVDTSVAPKADDNILREVVISDYTQLELPEHNAFYYLCGALLKKSVDHHNDCEILKLYLEGKERASNLSDEVRNVFEDFSKNRKMLLVPPSDFVTYIQRLEQVFYDVFEQTYICCKIGASIYELINDVKFPSPCPCFPKAYLQKLYIRMRIHFTIAANNKAFRTCQNSREDLTLSL